MDNYITWVDVVGYEGLYEVSDNGLIRTKEGKVTYTERHGKRVWKQRILSQRYDRQNSHRVNLWKDGEEKTHLVHRLVAEAFIPNPENKGFVNHIDGDRHNNNVSNLEWNTYTENTNHAFDNGLIKTGQVIKLINKDSGEEHIFRSKAKASEFLGRNHSFIHFVLKRGQTIVDNYEIVLED